MASVIPLKLVTSPSNVVARIDGIATGGTDSIEPGLILNEATGTAGVPVGTTMTQTLTNKTLTAPTINHVLVSAAKVLEFTGGGDAYFQMQGQAAGGGPRLIAASSAADADFVVVTKGAGLPKVRYNGAAAITLADLASAQTFITGIKDFADDILRVGATGWLRCNHTHQGATSGGTLDARFCFTAGAGAAALFAADIAAGTTITGAVAGVQAITNAVPTMPANTMAARTTFRITLTGKYTTVGAARTATFVITKNDGTDNYITTGAITLGNGVTNNRYRLEFLITCSLGGAAGTTYSVVQNGHIEGASSPAPAPVIMVAPVSLAAVDTTADTNKLWPLCTIAGGGVTDTLTNESFFIEKLN